MIFHHLSRRTTPTTDSQSDRQPRSFATRPLLRAAGLALGAAVALVGVAGCRQNRATPPQALPIESFKADWQATLPVDRKALRPDPKVPLLTVRRMDVNDNRLFVTTEANDVYIMDTGSGELLHIDPVAPGQVPIKRAVILNDQIIFPTTSTLEIYNNDGKLLRSVDVGHALRSPAIVGDKPEVYVGLDYPGGGRFAAIDLTKKYSLTRWEMMTPGTGISAGPARFRDQLFFASENGNVYGISTERAALWNLRNSAFYAGGRVVADLKVDDYGLYIASTDSKLYVLDRSTGKIKWQYYASSPLSVAPVVTEDTIYQYVQGKGLVALNKTDGKFNRDPKWVAPDCNAFVAQDEKFVYASSLPSKTGGMRLIALDRKTGEPVFQSSRGDLAVFATNTKDNTIYASTADGHVFAVKPVLKPGAVGVLVFAPVTAPMTPFAIAALAE